MKRLLVLLILLLAVPSYAQQCSEDTQIARLSPAIVGGSVPSTSTACTGILGFNATTGGEGPNIYTGLFIYRFVATETCTATTAHIYHDGYVAGHDAKVVVYLDDGDGNPDAGDTLIFLSEAVVDAAAEPAWYELAKASGSGSIVNGSSYWVGWVSSANGWGHYRYSTATKSTYDTDDGSMYTSPPATPTADGDYYYDHPVYIH